MTEFQTTLEPRSGDIPALMGLIFGVGAVGVVTVMLPWHLILVAGFLAGAAGTIGVVRARKVSKNRVARLNGLSGLLLGGLSMTTGIFQAPTITACGKTWNVGRAMALESAILNFRIEYGDLANSADQRWVRALITLKY